MRNRIRKIWAGAWLCVSIAAAALCASCSEDTTAVHRLDAGTEASKDSGSTGQCAAWIDLTVARWFVDGGLEVGANTENACTWPLDGALASASRAEVQFRIPPEKGFGGATDVKNAAGCGDLYRAFYVSNSRLVLCPTFCKGVGLMALQVRVRPACSAK